MSQQIEPILVKDDILMCSDKIGFAVSKGGQNVSFQRFPATSTSSTSHVYTINVPSTNVVMSREVLWTSEVTLTVSGIPAQDKYLLEADPDNNLYDCVAPFPLHQLTTNLSAQINNTTVSNTTNQILDPILRQLEKGKLSRYNTTTPVYLDNISDYTVESATYVNSPFGGFERAVDYNYPPRNSFKVSLVDPTQNSVGNGNTVKNVQVRFTSTEPLMLSPFVYGDAEKKAQGMYGISQINVTMTMDALAKRAFRWVTNSAQFVSPNVKSVTAVSYDKSALLCRFLSPHPSDMLPQENLVPYQQFTNYLRTENSTLAAGLSSVTTSNNIQLSAIPDKLICFIRDQQSNLNGYSADCYATITGVSILFNNQSGMLSSADITDLYRMSVEAGSQQSFLEYSGVSRVGSAEPNVGAAVGTTGSVLVLNFAEHIALSEEFYSCSSIGSFNFQIQVNYTNNTAHTITPELNTLFVHSGVFSCNNGVSASYIGVLNKQQVLDASLQVPVGKADLARMVGGGFFDTIKSIASKALPMIKRALPMAKNILGQIDHPAAKKGVEALGSLGYGATGGMATGGMETGGRRRIKHL